MHSKSEIRYANLKNVKILGENKKRSSIKIYTIICVLLGAFHAIFHSLECRCFNDPSYQNEYRFAKKISFIVVKHLLLSVCRIDSMILHNHFNVDDRLYYFVNDTILSTCDSNSMLLIIRKINRFYGFCLKTLIRNPLLLL